MTREALLNILDSGETGSDILNLLDSLVVSDDGQFITSTKVDVNNSYQQEV